jgi:hypothetical protein
MKPRPPRDAGVQSGRLACVPRGPEREHAGDQDRGDVGEKEQERAPGEIEPAGPQRDADDGEHGDE